jgi:hypothetical protein
MVRNSKALDPFPLSTINERGGGKHTVRSGTMCVEVDQGNLYTATRTG